MLKYHGDLYIKIIKNVENCSITEGMTDLFISGWAVCLWQMFKATNQLFNP